MAAVSSTSAGSSSTSAGSFGVASGLAASSLPSTGSDSTFAVALGVTCAVRTGRSRFAFAEARSFTAGVVEALDALGAYLLGVVAVTHEQHGDRSLDDDLKAAAPPEVAYRIAAALSIDPVERQSLLELATAAERLREETRILRRETDRVRDLLVRLRARGERGGLN